VRKSRTFTRKLKWQVVKELPMSPVSLEKSSIQEEISLERIHQLEQTLGKLTFWKMNFLKSLVEQPQTQQ